MQEQPKDGAKEQPSIFPHGRKRGTDIKAKSAAKLRTRVRNLERANDKLESRNEDLQERIQQMDIDAKAGDRYREEMDANLNEMHQKIVLLEKENRNFASLLGNLQAALSGKKQGTWVIGEVSDLPAEIRTHMALINRVQELLRDRERLEKALEGAELLWLYVGDSEKQSVLKQLDGIGETQHRETFDYFSKRVQKKPKETKRGEIVQFAGPRDKF